MRKYFAHEADDFDDLPAFSEEKMNCIMTIAAVCTLVATIAVAVAAIVSIFAKKND